MYRIHRIQKIRLCKRKVCVWGEYQPNGTISHERRAMDLGQASDSPSAWQSASLAGSGVTPSLPVDTVSGMGASVAAPSSRSVDSPQVGVRVEL